jgi:type IV pilus assembly protein PilQ
MQANRNRKLWAALLVVLWSPVLGAQEPQPQAKENEIRTDAEGDRSSRLTLRLKDRDLREVVNSIRRKANINIVMDAAIEETVTIDLQDVHWRQALNLVAESAGCIVTDLEGGVLRVEKPPRVYFSFPNTDIQTVIDTIAKISGANIVVAPEVKGTITLRLKNVPWRDALDAAVKTLGFVVVEEGRGILRVVPASNIQKDLVMETFQLRYVRPKSTYLPFIQSQYLQNKASQQQLTKGEIEFTLLDALKRVVSPDVGKLDYFDEINVIVVKDTKPVVDEIRRIINQVDVEPAQVFLDVKFVTTTNEDVLDVGVSPGGNGWTASVGLGAIPHRYPFDLGAGGWDDKFIVNDLGIGPFADPALNVGGGTTIPNVVFGTMDFTQMTMTLRLLKKDSRAEILQAPKIVALDHQTATIFVGEAVRYAQARVEQGQAGGLLLALEEGDDSPVNIGFQLLVTPHIVPGTDKVIMEVIPQRTALTGTGASTLAPAGFDVFRVGTGGEEGSIALPRVASSTIVTKVLLRSGQTAVLGGLVSRTQTDTEIKLPLLGDIPLLGYLFKNKTTNDTRSTLIVFITPSVIRSAEDTQQSMNRVLRERFEMRQRLLEQRDAIFGGSGN